MLSLILFIVVCIIVVGFGLLIISPAQRWFTPLEQWVIGAVIGMAAWALLVYGFAWINLKTVSFVIAVMASIFGWWKNRSLLKTKYVVDWIAGGIIVLGIVGQLFLVAPSGFTYNDGIRFYGVNAHDGMWHVTLMESLSHTFPPELPTYSGIPLKGYHYVIDLWGSELARVFQIPAVDLTFRWFPLLFSLITGLGSYAFLRRITKTKTAVYVGLFLMYFAGSFGYVLSIIGHQRHAGETAFWAQQSISTFINLPLGASFALVVVTLLLLHIYFKEEQISLLWLASLLIGISLPVKAYGGVLMVGGFCFILMIYGFIKRRPAVFGPMMFSVLLTLLFVLPQLQPGKPSFLIQPGWFLKTMMESPDHVNYPLWELQRQTYAAHNNYPRIIEYWMIAFGIFFVGNMGARTIGLLAYKKRSFTILFMWIVMVTSIAIPTLLLQTGIVWNAIQFVYYALFVMNFLTAMVIDSIPRPRFRVIVVILLVACSLPTSVKALLDYGKMYSKSDSYFLIPNKELEALSFVNSLPDSAKILTAYSYESYIPAMTGKSVYYVDETQAMILLLPLDRRQSVVRMFCHKADDEEIKGLMEQNKLTYIYTTKSKNVDCHPNFDNNPYLTKVFSNELSSVYKLN